jgi:hypothetical protein
MISKFRTIAIFTSSALLKVVHPLKIYQYTKLHGPRLTGASCVHLINWNVRHFGIVDATELKIWRRCNIQ